MPDGPGELQQLQSREEFTEAEVRQLRTLLQRAQDDQWAGQPLLSGTFPRYQSYEALPTAGPEFGYTTILLKGTPDIAYICVRDALGTWGWASISTVPIVLSEFIERNEVVTDHHFHGIFDSLLTAQSINSGGGFSTTPGISRIALAVIAGSDTAGTITFTGTSVDRDTGVETGSDTEVVTIAGVTTDASDTDADGNPRLSFTSMYLTNKWWTGSVALTTTDVNLSNVDVYAIAYEQFNSEPSIIIDALDITFKIVTGTASFWAYLYSVMNTSGNKFDITREATVGKSAADLAVKPYRMRRGELGTGSGVLLAGATDGIWVDGFPGSVQRFEHMTIKVWAHAVRTGLA